MAASEDKHRTIKTLAAYSTDLCMACGCSVLGPTLVSMGYLLHTDTTHMALSLAGQRLGYLLGTLLCGVCFTRTGLPPELQFAMGCLGITVTMAIAPWQQHVYSFISILLLMGVALGYVDAGLQAYVMKLWCNHHCRNTVLQSLHFTWSACATVMPFFISLFLEDIPQSHVDRQASNFSQLLNASLLSNNSTTDYVQDNSSENQSYHFINSTQPDLLDQSMRESIGLVRWAYVSIAGFTLVNTLYIFIVYLITSSNCKKEGEKPETVTDLLAENKKDDENPKTDGDTTNTDEEKANSKEATIDKENAHIDDIVVIEVHRDTPNCYRNIILFFLFLFAFLYQCVEGIPGGFLAAFCAQGLGWHLETGAVLIMVYWGAQGTGRLLSMLLSWAISPRTLIIINLICLSSGYLLLQFVLQLGATSVWVAMAIGGLGLGSSLPSSFLWVSDYMTMTSAVSATALAGSCLAGVLILPLTGFLFDTLGPMVMVYMLGLSALLFVATFIAMQLWASYGILLFSPERVRSEEEIHIQVNEEKEGKGNGMEELKV